MRHVLIPCSIKLRPMKLPSKIKNFCCIILFTSMFSVTLFAADNAALEKRIDELSQELATLKLQIQQQNQQSQAGVPAKTISENKAGVANANLVGASATETKDTTLGGYGE